VREEVPSLRPPAVAATGLDAEDETERRIAHLEKRIEELGEARDRLERQIAAQTEELRVQRAAIARTQRVLRSIAPKGDEEPSEPLVRG
jgi:septal ring factor EnvC (AmiA/AmiB activator)